MTENQAAVFVRQNKTWRQALDAILQDMKLATKAPVNLPGNENPKRSSRNRSISITHLEDSIMRLGMDMKDIEEELPGSAPDPYPQSRNPDSRVVEKTADGLKL